MTTAKCLYMGHGVEVWLDLRQWAIGWNRYPDTGWNVFVGPVRIGKHGLLL